MCPNSHASAKEKKRKGKRTKIRKTNKSEKKWKEMKIYNLYNNYLPGNGAKNLTRLKSWFLIPSAGVSK